jgi:hypothetical protein
MLGPSRWIVIAATSPTGKTLFVCQCCGRIAPTPDKTCQTDFLLHRVLTVRCEDWERSERLMGPREAWASSVAANARAAVRDGDEVFESLDEEKP